MVKIVAIGASEGGFEPLRRIVASLPVPCAAAVFVVVHIGAHQSLLPSLLNRVGISSEFAYDGCLIEPGHIYVAPPDHHMRLEDGHIRVNQGPKVHYSRPAVDPLFMSAAEFYGQNVMGIVLSGGDGDGAFGLRAINERSGTALVQHPSGAVNASMPSAAVEANHPESLSVDEIAHRVEVFCSPRG